ncbi:GntR family transcriptional regulator [Flexivirga endophytica]|uniref:GntR family transcriptional regulator n=1 Tax=Flexivirga endophytica TaxID=1849103 RepID=A0A916T290_9MICO|nr:GntR family transcriptional regulator [Flexivirga endophytica]GGB27036.1 GntR family transcriptional regulator [Flexivirga endophytica]GHB55523.1 GntR family transcriptional regulator [Flexivirga endophytica]
MSASDKAYEFVKQGILSGALAPSTFLTEGQLADEVGVSRTPVREALLRLQAEGMVELFPKKGALVVAATPREARETFEARGLIEEWAAGQVWPRRADTVPTLHEKLDQMCAALKADDIGAFSVADRAFHEVIVEAAGNSVIARQYRHLRDRQIVIVAGSMRADKSRMASSVKQHKELVQLLETGTRAAFVRACREHVAHATSLVTSR